MSYTHLEDQPEAGPSSRPFVDTPVTPPVSTRSPCPLGSQCPKINLAHRPGSDFDSIQRTLTSSKSAGKRKMMERQDFPGPGGSTYSISTVSGTSPPSDTMYAPLASTLSNPLFNGPTTTQSSYSPYNTSLPYTTFSYNVTQTYESQPFTSPSPSTSSTSSRSTKFTSLWSYTPSHTRSQTASASQPTQSIYVPGVLLNLTLGGDSETEAIYSVEMAFGHNADSGSSAMRRKSKRRPAKWDGGAPQAVNLQIDLGSSDMWLATTDCTSDICDSAPSLFDASQSLESGIQANITYQSGAVDGEIYWEEVALADFGIGFQAFIGATTVDSEDLKNGNFTGVLGLALPAASTILTEIGGTTGSDPDGATFLDNLFGSGNSAPSERLFSLSLARREDVRTASTFGIGAVSSSFCPPPCSPSYIPIVAQPQLGATGFLHWRIQMQSVSVTTWGNAQTGTDPTTKTVPLGASRVYASKSSPLAVLDSGGVQILVGYRPYADAIYSALGVSMSPDGLYRMPCTQQMAITFRFNSREIPVHPLDMSYMDPADSSQSTCIGMIQYSNNLGESGDFILGSSFLKNVYSVFQYPDANKPTTWQPSVGLIPLTNASIASQDFYAVRTLRQSLSTVSSSQQATYGGTTPSGGQNPQSSAAAAASGKKVVSTAVIAAVSVVGFFVLAAAAFCAWWFWLRRKLGPGGVVEYKTPPVRPRGGAGHRSESSTSTLKNKKHSETSRQKSMVEGYSDFEGDSWLSTTEGGDSIRLGYMPEVAEEDDEARQTRGAEWRSSRGSSLARERSVDTDVDIPLVDMVDTKSPPQRDRSPLATRRVLSDPEIDLSVDSANSESFSPVSAPYPYPSNANNHSQRTSTAHAARSLSMAMDGPFPSTGQNRHSTMRPDVSPMYDIRTSDYFAVPISHTAGRGRSGQSQGQGSRGSRSGEEVSQVAERRESRPHKYGGVLGDAVMEEPGDMADNHTRGAAL
ncbi:hypothetical protein CI109_106795 [Kwoniella shandongensis]|uniref:Uncharacterized protein n=1 Tax=Kwoniella shandongensis TaxID=1734106 RepID=A0A5M6C6M9_9TREE|nr:uncharacterized protein CI109_000948 [Kwoniella shandongensis]KAA5530768.1 hypothetical protein CI109_000948 [Kwoniella shandongensis]